jgi:hypothetical protein
MPQNIPPATLAAMRGMSPQMLQQIGVSPEQLQAMVGQQPMDEVPMANQAPAPWAMQKPMMNPRGPQAMPGPGLQGAPTSPQAPWMSPAKRAMVAARAAGGPQIQPGGSMPFNPGQTGGVMEESPATASPIKQPMGAPPFNPGSPIKQAGGSAPFNPGGAGPMTRPKPGYGNPDEKRKMAARSLTRKAFSRTAPTMPGAPSA